ncbi:type I polyketide synthase [Mycobacterium sp.]|uniref:type I polyketide synthase n=1 Tax=Mycobacterium sp. TaxID=1785 RepID=UPI003C772158
MTSLAERAAQLSPQAREALARELIRAGTAFPIDAVAEPVAVVGMGCRFPGDVLGPDSFWRLLTDGVDAIGEVPADRWDADAYYDPDPLVPGRMTTKWGGFVSDVAGFDAEFFGITPREAKAMDPQARMLLEVSWEALEHAGIPADSLGGTRTGVMMGMASWDYTIVNIERRAEIDAYLSTGNPHNTAVGRISYLLGLQGPSVAVDTACSSSLVAVHLACQSLRLRESDLALAGGVQLSLSPFTSIALSKWSALSPRGRCHTFDAAADGFVRGEGAGVVVLKRLADAVRDGDRVLAVVRGSAVNQDGRSNGLTAPNVLAQRDVITDALRAGNVAPDSVNYIEAHGTGTVLGDPIEFEALAATYGRGDNPCALGAVKTNIGHLEAAAGVAGFIKAVLALGHNEIPPNLHFHRWNPGIDPSPTRFFVPTEATPWPTGRPKRAAVSSFGFGGTNAHVVLEQAPEPVPATAREPGTAVTTFVVSGKTTERVASWAAVLAEWMDGDGANAPLTDVAHTLNHHRARYARSATVVARDHAEAVAGLRALAAGRPTVGVAGPFDRPCGPGTVFVYSGQGSQWAGMGRQLLADEPAFAAAVAELEPTFVAQTGFSLQQVLTEGQSVTGIERIQPVLVGVQLALTALWRSYGVEPDAVIGHSMGEVTAAVVAGALSVADGLRVIATRSRLMSRLSGQGAMGLLELDSAAAEELLADYPDVSLAVYASPRQTVIAGPPERVDAMIATVAARDLLARRIDVEVASHHRIIDAVLPELRDALADLAPMTPKIPLISTTGGHAEEPTFDADYWAANLRNPVQFSQAIGTAAENHATFLEMSPHPLLTHAITDTLESAAPGGRVLVTAAMNRDQDQTLFFHTQLAAVGAAAPGAEGGRLAELPRTPWQHCDFWVADRSSTADLDNAHPLLGAHMELPSGHDHVWQADVGTDVCPWLADHKVQGQPTLPAAAFAEIAVAACSEALGLPAQAVSVLRLEVEQMLPLDSHTRITTQANRGADGTARVEIYSRSAADRWVRHAVAEAVAAQGDTLPARQDQHAEAPGSEVSPADFYVALRQTGQYHGPAFAALTRIVRRGDGATGAADTEITVPEQAPRHPGFRIHPVMLDAALQSVAAAMSDRTIAEAAEVSYLPVSFEKIRLFGDVGRHARCHATVVDLDDTTGAAAGKLGTIVLTDDAGDPTAEITGVYLRRVERRAVPLPLPQKIFGTTWVQSPAAPAEPGPAGSSGSPGSWLVLSDDTDAALMADEFAAGWRSPERRVVTAKHVDESAVLAAFAETCADADRPPVGVVLFVGGGSADLSQAVTHAKDSIWSVASTIRAVIGGWHGRPPRLWLVTRRGLVTPGLGVDDSAPGDPAVGALKGLIRVLAYENPDLRATLVDLDAAENALTDLSVELGSSDADDVVAWRDGRRYVERLSRASLGSPKQQPVVRPGAAYIITGGLGGLGLVVARWLVDAGAGRVVLNSRNIPPDEPALAELGDKTEIAVVTGDISDPGTAERLVAAAEETGRELRGIVHGAAVVEDSLLATMSKDNLERVWTPKAVGSVRLHQASLSRDLDWWVAFSSVASLLGSPGQAAYACASAWLDALVASRSASGLPAVSINWGQWSDVGVAQALASSILDPISPAEGIEALESLLGTDRTVTGVARLRADRALAAFPEIRDLGYFAGLVEELDMAGDGGDWVGAEALRDLDPAEAQRVVADRLAERIAAVMGYGDRAAVDPTQPLTTLGMDSLMAVRIRRTARADFGVEPPVALLLQGASLQDVASDVIRQLGLTGGDAPRQADQVRERAEQRAAARRDAARRRNRGQLV